MSYKTILLIPTAEARFPGQLGLAIDLATQFGAHLIALALLPAPLRLPAGMPGAPDVLAIDGYRTSCIESFSRLHTAFTAATADRAVSAQWLQQDAGHAEAVQLAHSCDLVIAGAADPGLRNRSFSASIEHLIIDSGRPALIAPRKNGHHQIIGGRVLIAWNGSRESARAVGDAMPVLKSASQVKVLTIDDGAITSDAALGDLDRLREALARHGVRAEAELIALPGADIGSALISAIKAFAADLLVMGCYGRPRLYEHMLGGATRHLMLDSPIPVLMSH